MWVLSLGQSEGGLEILSQDLSLLVFLDGGHDLQQNNVSEVEHFLLLHQGNYDINIIADG